jgi:hypothetical protein
MAKPINREFLQSVLAMKRWAIATCSKSGEPLYEARVGAVRRSAASENLVRAVGVRGSYSWSVRFWLAAPILDALNPCR